MSLSKQVITQILAHDYSKTILSTATDKTFVVLLSLDDHGWCWFSLNQSSKCCTHLDPDLRQYLSVPEDIQFSYVLPEQLHAALLALHSYTIKFITNRHALNQRGTVHIKLLLSPNIKPLFDIENAVAALNEFAIPASRKTWLYMLHLRRVSHVLKYISLSYDIIEPPDDLLALGNSLLAIKRTEQSQHPRDNVLDVPEQYQVDYDRQIHISYDTYTQNKITQVAISWEKVNENKMFCLISSIFNSETTQGMYISTNHLSFTRWCECVTQHLVTLSRWLTQQRRVRMVTLYCPETFRLELENIVRTSEESGNNVIYEKIVEHDNNNNNLLAMRCGLELFTKWTELQKQWNKINFRLSTGQCTVTAQPMKRRLSE